MDMRLPAALLAMIRGNEIMNKTTSLLFLLLSVQMLAQSPDLQSPPVFNASNQPARTHGTGGGCRFNGPLLYVASATAGSEGILVRVSPPATGRYKEGAPVVVHMLSSMPRVDSSIACLSEQGFVDVGFLCQGVEYKTPDGKSMKSGGSAFPPDPRRCIEPLADVLAFATGKTRSLEGKSIQDYTGPVTALTDQAGVIGWSLGGNLAVCAMARYGDRFPNLKWYVSWESPFLGTTEDRGSVAQANPFYDATTGKIDFSRLRYSPEMPIWVFPPVIPASTPGWPHGGLYLDGDGNGVFNKDTDFAFFANMGGPGKFFYSPLVTREAVDRKVFGTEWPKHIATLSETERNFAQEDPLQQIPAVVKAFPKLSALVFESRQNHVIDAADHPHTVAQVNAWIDAGAHWVRFNPDAHYVEAAMGKRPSKTIQYPAFQRLDRSSIRDLLEPEEGEGGPTDKEGVTAAICEIADRTHLNTWTPVLRQVLVAPRKKELP
jgi:hypothetical protein